MTKAKHKQMDKTSASMAQFLDRKREERKKQHRFMKDRFGATARGGRR